MIELYFRYQYLFKIMLFVLQLLSVLLVVFLQLVISTSIKTLIIGGGPAGLLTSHCLLSKYKNGEYLYDVNIIESRENPLLEQPGPRSYSLG